MSETPLVTKGTADEEDFLFEEDPIPTSENQPSRITQSKLSSLPDDEEEMLSENEDFPHLPQMEAPRDHQFETDTYFAIKEEDDEEDSFELEKKSKRERLQFEFERKMDLIEKKLASTIFEDIKEPKERGFKTFVDKRPLIPKFDGLFSPDQIGEAAFE